MTVAVGAAARLASEGASRLGARGEMALLGGPSAELDYDFRVRSLRVGFHVTGLGLLPGRFEVATGLNVRWAGIDDAPFVGGKAAIVFGNTCFEGDICGGPGGLISVEVGYRFGLADRIWAVWAAPGVRLYGENVVQPEAHAYFGAFF